MKKMALQRPNDQADNMSQKQKNESDTDSLSTSKKRLREETEEEDTVLSPEALAKMSRSERKRHREKKRRSDVNKGFDDLTALLLEIDPVVRAEAEDRARRGQWKGNVGGQDDNILSRVELIARTVEVLQRVHKENEQRKLIIEQLLQRPSTSTMSSYLQLGSQQIGVGPHGSNGGPQQHLNGLTSLPQLRPDQTPGIRHATVAPFYQQHFGGPSIDTFLGLGNAQIQSFPNFLAYSTHQTPAPTTSLIHQLASSRENAAAAAAFARDRQYHPEERRGKDTKDN